jgi:hypothetical protein
MSRFMMNKLMRSVEMSDSAVHQYVADARGFVDQWLEDGAGPDRAADDRVLDAKEHEAFATKDYAALYALGAHPYLLWHFTEAVLVHETTWPELNERYREAVRVHGYPDSVV